MLTSVTHPSCLRMCLICHSLWHIKHIFSSGHRTTVEGLPNVHTSSTTRNSGRATLLAGKCTCRSSKVESIFICDQLKVILSFCYPVIPNSAFHWPPYCAIWLCGHFISYQFATHWKCSFIILQTVVLMFAFYVKHLLMSNLNLVAMLSCVTSVHNEPRSVRPARYLIAITLSTLLNFCHMENLIHSLQ